MGEKWKGKQREEVTASVRPDEEATQQERRRERRPPLLALTFVRKATDADSSTSVEEMCKRIYGGFLMNGNTRKFWVDEDLDKNCFLLLAKELDIVWIHDPRYWRWIDQKEECYSGEVDVTMAELSSVCWLKISGTFKTIALSPKTTYDVAFVVNMSKSSSGWHLPVNLKLSLPDGTTQGRIESMVGKPKGEWIDVLVGTFITTPENVGEISFSFHETGDHWKSGLLVKGVVFQPKDEASNLSKSLNMQHQLEKR